MVIWIELTLLAESTLLQRLDPDTRARVLGALAGLILLGFLLVGLVWWGARATRRYIRRGDDRRVEDRPMDDDWHHLSRSLPSPEDSD